MRLDLATPSNSHKGWDENHIAIIDSDADRPLVRIMIGNGSGQAMSLCTPQEVRVIVAALLLEVERIENVCEASNSD